MGVLLINCHFIWLIIARGFSMKKEFTEETVLKIAEKRNRVSNFYNRK